MIKKFTKLKAFMTFLMIIFLIISASSPALAAGSQVISKVNTTSKVVALTFDDGSDGTNNQKILQILLQNNIKSTFFVRGKSAELHPLVIKAVAAQGHEVVNHSYSHPYFTRISTTMMKDELNKTETILKNLTGKTTKPFFRPPYGAYNTTVLQAVGEVGYTKTIMWTVDTLDWTGNAASVITQRVLSNVTPGAIFLMHTGAGTNTVTALPAIIRGLRAKGYSITTVSRLLTYAPTTPVIRYIVKAGDTLTKIAALYGVTVTQIVSANKLVNANMISVGQVLTIPPKTPTTYIVKAGDTLTKIAAVYGVTVAQIVTANKLVNANLISVNQVLIIPK